MAGPAVCSNMSLIFTLVPWMALTDIKLSLHPGKFLIPFLASFSSCFCLPGDAQRQRGGG